MRRQLRKVIQGCDHSRAKSSDRQKIGTSWHTSLLLPLRLALSSRRPYVLSFVGARTHISHLPPRSTRGQLMCLRSAYALPNIIKHYSCF